MTQVHWQRLAGPLLILAAALACLQPGIDPVFLTLLSAHNRVAHENHGLIVGATQLGMAIGALAIWRAGAWLPRHLMAWAAAMTLAVSLMTVGTGATGSLIGLRFAFGLGMGLIYTKAMSDAAVGRPAGAYGAMFLVQLLLSTLVGLTLPAIADRAGGTVALGALALAPAILLALALSGALASQGGEPAVAFNEGTEGASSARGWGLVLANLLFISATMVVWSFTGALAVEAGLSEQVIGNGVAIGALAGAATALAVMREQTLLPLPLTALVGGVAVLAPLFLTRPGADALFIVGVILLNLGSTALIVRCSGAATKAAGGPVFRRFVACTHSLGMVCGPVLGSIAARVGGDGGVETVALLAVAAGCCAAGFADRGHGIVRAPKTDEGLPRPALRR